MMPLVAPFLQAGAGQSESEDVGAFLKACGEQSLSWLFDLYLDPSFAPTPFFLNILNGYGRPPPKRPIGGSATGLHRDIAPADIRPGHGSLQCRLGAEGAVRPGRLGREERGHGDAPAVQGPLALDLLRDGIKRDNWEEKLEVMSLISRHRLWDLIDDMLALVKTFVIREEDAVHNEQIIREIAAAGDPAVTPHLLKLAKQRWSFSPRRLGRMKRLIRELLPAAS
jgi:hypothetical protein